MFLGLLTIIWISLSSISPALHVNDSMVNVLPLLCQIPSIFAAPSQPASCVVHCIFWPHMLVSPYSSFNYDIFKYPSSLLSACAQNIYVYASWPDNIKLSPFSHLLCANSFVLWSIYKALSIRLDVRIFIYQKHQSYLLFCLLSKTKMHWYQGFELFCHQNLHSRRSFEI